MGKVLKVSDLLAITGHIAAKMEEGAWTSSRNVTYHFTGLTDSVLGWLRGKCYEQGDLNIELFARWVVRAGWVGMTFEGERADIEREPVRFAGDTPDASGFLPMVPWPLVEALGADLPGLFLAISNHTEQSEVERARLGFTVGSSTTAEEPAPLPLRDVSAASASGC